MREVIDDFEMIPVPPGFHIEFDLVGLLDMVRLGVTSMLCAVSSQVLVTRYDVVSRLCSEKRVTSAWASVAALQRSAEFFFKGVAPRIVGL